tara:strand:+ start:91 stop:1389 length:1299 start_codon:yes stop_codon:yes gene_type:complete
MVSPVKTEWWFDMEEEYNDGTVVEFSFGPLQYNYDSVISVQQFVDDINNLFENTYRAANNPGEAYPLYYIYAKTLGGYYNDNRTKNNFNLRYYIQAVFHEGQDVVYGGLNTFKIKFKTGPHGFEVADLQNAGIVPRGVATIKSDLDARAAVIPYSSHISTILDNPPVPPDFRIVPYSGVSNRLLLLLNSSTGEYTTTPVIIKETDRDAIINQYVAQGNTLATDVTLEELIENGKLRITYKNDDPIDRYEIFRTTTKPNSYTDFAVSGAPHKIISGRITIDKRASGAHLIDKVIPNTKYYYCVRAIDVHNNFSNPTHIFEAELVDNEGQVYLILKTIYLENITDQKIKTKSGRRYVYIEPSLRNLQYTTPISQTATTSTLPGNNILDQVTLTDAGNIDADCWDKTLKIRVTSKKTGRKVDLNVTFKNTGVITP